MRPPTPRFHTAFFIIFAVAALATLCSVLPARAATEADDAGAKALTKLDEDWSKTAASKDADKIAAFYAEDATAYPPNEPVAVGRAAAKKVWASMLADPKFQSISWKTTHSEVAKSGDMGYTAGTYDFAFKGPDGKTAHEKGKYVCIWKKQADATWKASQDIWNADAK